MHKKIRWAPYSSYILFLVILFGMAFPGNLFAETLYAKSSKTKLQESASAKSKVVALLRKGATVNVLEKQKKFYKVSVGGKQGWVFRFKLSSKRPASGAGLDGLMGSQKVAASGSASGSSIRGLSPVSEDYGKRKGIGPEHIRAVKEMERRSVTLKELDQFMEQGKLGEYGE